MVENITQNFAGSLEDNIGAVEITRTLKIIVRAGVFPSKSIFYRVFYGVVNKIHLKKNYLNDCKKWGNIIKKHL